MSEKGNELKLLNDLPVGVKPESDRFEHDIYARILSDVFQANPPGIAVGLFGNWGHGKSTIVNLLEKHLPDKVKLVVFNAWKARGDSVRRQLLLRVLKAIGSPIYDSVSRFVQPGVPLRLKPFEEQQLYSDRRIWWLLTTSEKLDPWVAGAIIVGVISVIGAISLIFRALSSSTDPNALVIWAISYLLGICGSCMMIAFRWFQNRRQMILASAEPVSDSQRLKYPEQFQRLFEQEVCNFCKDGKKLLIVVDDLDRCDPGTVVEALSAIRQFSGTPTFIEGILQCQFLVPCDEEQVVLALEADGHGTRRDEAKYHDYRTELLRKFFDVIIRMDQFLPEGLTIYASEIAADIGLEQQAARELIDLVNPSNPRQIKKLLNAYKIALEKLYRRQQRELLPVNSAMPELDRTLMVLVALRETSPRAYIEICSNPSLLSKYRRNNMQAEELPEVLVDVSGILERAGRIAVYTAEYIIFGQYEPELIGLEEGGVFALAFREQNHEQFGKLLGRSIGDARDRFRRWMLSKIRKTPTVSRLRGDLAMFADYGAKGEEERKYIMPCVEQCAAKESLIKGALDDFSSFDQLETVLPAMAEEPKQRILDAVLSNFLKGPDKRDRELSFLFSVISWLRDRTKKSFIRWLEKYARESQDSQDRAVVERLLNALPADRDKCRGAAPSVAVILAQKQAWTDDHDEETKDTTEKWPRYQLIPLLVGSDKKAVSTCMKHIFGQSGQLANPSQLSQPTVGIKPAWKTIKELATVVDRSEAPKLFPNFQKWLQPQSDAKAAKTILDALEPLLFDLDEPQLKEFGDYLATVLWNNQGELWLCDYTKKPTGKVQMEKWSLLCNHIFLRLDSNLKGQAALNNQQQQILKRVAAYRWPVAVKADELLAAKLRQIPQGATQRLEEWLECLVPLLDKKRASSGEAIRELLRERKNIKETLRAGKSVLWNKVLSEGEARVIANMCVDLGDQISTHSEQLDALADLEGSTRMFEVIIDLLEDDRNWLKGRMKLLEFVARGSSKVDTAHQRRFLGKVKRLILTDEDTTIVLGLQVVENCERIDGEVEAEAKRLHKQTNNEEIRQLAERILSKKKLE